MNKVLAVAMVAICATFTLAAEDTVVKIAADKATVVVTDMTVSDNGSALNASYTIEVAPGLVPDCASIILTPVIKKGSEKFIPEVILINGKNVCKHEKWLDCKLFEVVEPKNVRCFHADGSPIKIESSYSIPMKDWMDDAEFDVVSQKVTYESNCIKGFPGSEYICPVPFKTFVPEPMPIKVVRPDYSVKHAIKTRLYYPVNGTAEIDSYFENAEALAILDALDKDNFTVKSIDIEGWASPESSVAYNQALSLKRAATVKNIISRKFKFDEAIFTTQGNGEFWDYVLAYIDNADDATIEASREQLQKAIADNDNLDKREAAIKAIAGGKPYRAIFNATYPRSRFAECTVNYNIRQFNLETAKLLYKSNPATLTADDYATWLLQAYDKSVAAKALELYPEDKDLNAVAAQHAAQAGEYQIAIDLYKKAGDSKEVLNNLACCYYAIGDIETAKEYLKQAGVISK